jgi:O-antigen/teichoic acid export membrane protein
MLIKKSVAWISLAQFGTLILQLASSVVVARHITPYEMGIFAIGIAFVGVISIFQQLGLPAFLIREEKLNDSLIATAFSINAVLTILLSLVIFAASFAGALLFSEPGVQKILAVLALAPLTGIFAFVPAAMLERQGRFKRLSIISLAANVTTYVSAMTLVVLNFSYMGLAYGQLAGSTVLAVLTIIAGRRFFSIRPGVQHWRQVAKFGGNMLLIASATSGAQRISELVLGAAQGMAGLGLYNRASGLINMLWASTWQIVGRISFVRFSDLNRSGTNVHDQYILGLSLVSATLWPMFAGLAVIAEPMISFVYGERWVGAAPVLTLLAIGSMIAVPVSINYQLLVSAGCLKHATRVEVLRSVAGTGLFSLGSFLSLTAAAGSRIAESIAHVMLYRPYVREKTGVTRSELGAIYFNGLALTLLAVAPAAFCVYVLGADSDSPLLLALSIVAGGLLWLGGLGVLRHPLWNVLLTLLPQWLGARIAGGHSDQRRG